MKPQIEYFEETREVEFGEVAVGVEFVNHDATFTRMHSRRGVNATGPDFHLAEFQYKNLVTIHRPHETKPLGECEPGDVFTISGDTEVFRKLTPDPFGRPGWGYMRESDSKLVYFDRAIVVTIIGKVVCDG
ncbi:MAG: hypothetical protein KAJ19_13520 [Gammaproteobacteria bacterium]|nr:hypothetical protein [Gammaproteobacteria bacterium]